MGAKPVRIADVIDGTSNTAMLGEKRLKLYQLGASVDDNEACYSPGAEVEVMRYAKVDDDNSTFGPSRDLTAADPPTDPVNAGLRQFGSSHPTGCNLVLADGSVRLVRYQPDNELFRRLCVRNDGKVVDFDGF